MKHLMFNVQTLGRLPGSGIVEIGWCLFDDFIPLKAEDQQAAELTIPVEQNALYGLGMNSATLKWWLEKQGGLRPNLRNEKRPNVTLPQVLSELASQWNELTLSFGIHNLWSKYPLFHVGILKAAFDHVGVERPILLREENFRGWKCAATMKKEMRMYFESPIATQTVKLIDAPFGERDGRAKLEALAEAAYLTKLYQSIRNYSKYTSNLELELHQTRRTLEQKIKDGRKARPNIAKRKKR